MSGLLFPQKATNAVQPQAAQGLRVQSSVYGRPITLLYGVNRISGNLIWYGNFQSHSHTTQTQSGGKGGGGGSSGSTSYTYTAGVAIGLCEGPTTGILRMWAGANGYTQGQSNSVLGFTLFGGAQGQSPWSFLTANYPGQNLGYSGTAYMANPNLDLGTSPNLPNYSFEVVGLLAGGGNSYDGWDCNPSEIIVDFLADQNHGVGWSRNWIDATRLADYQLYCNAMAFLFSPVYDSQTQAQQAIQDLLDSSNSACWWSDGQLKIRPYADQVVVGNGYTYTPDVTPVFALNDDAFIFSEGQDPVQVSRISPADAFNIVDVEFVNRSNAYAPQVAEAKDLYAAQQFGARADNVRMYHHICTDLLAQRVANLILQRNLYIRNSYQFVLGWAYCALEPMDLVTLTDARMGFSNLAVRITSVEENANGELTFTAEDFPFGVATAPLYTVQAPVGYNTAWNSPADPVMQVVFYEPPGTVTNNQLVLWVGVAGVNNWGGANVWVSVDGNSYVRVGTIDGPARVGVTTTDLGINGDPDTVDQLGVNLSTSGGELTSGTQADADTFNTLCVVGEELISYQTAGLTGTANYTLNYLRRGGYNTAESAWPIGTQFMRADQSVFSYPFDSQMMGKPIYVKLVSFNSYGGGETDLSVAPVFTYTIQGIAINASLPDVMNLYTNYVSGITQLFWSPITDYRSFDYEIRVGQSWNTGIFLARTNAISFATTGNGTYWVAAHFRNPNGFDVYSDNPADVLVVGSILVLNNIANYDEVATGWTGTLTGGAAISSSTLTLAGAGDVLGLSNFLTLSDVIHFGGISSAGTYALPSGHAINVQRVANASVRLSFTGYGSSITDNVLTIPDVLVAPDLLGAISGGFVTITPQIAIADASHVYGAWQNYLPGVYVGQYFKAQVLLTTRDTTITPLVTALTFAVDLETRVETFTNQAIASGGTTLTFPNGTYNSGPNGTATPNVQVSVLNSIQGDTVVISGKSLTQVSIQILNGGGGVARTIDATVTGY